MIRIGYLYPDLMNLYGENGNVRILTRHLQDQGIPVEIVRIDTEMEPDFDSIQLLYMGCATERNQLVALEALRPFSERLYRYLDGGGQALMTGNSFELLGKELRLTDECRPALGLFGFSTEVSKTQRDSCDVLLSSPLFDCLSAGFINKASQVFGISESEAPFRVVFGVGNHAEDEAEDFFKNLLATHTIAPLTARNPHIVRRIVSRLCELDSKEYREIVYENEQRAYAVVVNELEHRMAQEKAI